MDTDTISMIQWAAALPARHFAAPRDIVARLQSLETSRATAARIQADLLKAAPASRKAELRAKLANTVVEIKRLQSAVRWARKHRLFAGSMVHVQPEQDALRLSEFKSLVSSYYLAIHALDNKVHGHEGTVDSGHKDDAIRFLDQIVKEAETGVGQGAAELAGLIRDKIDCEKQIERWYEESRGIKIKSGPDTEVTEMTRALEAIVERIEQVESRLLRP